MIAIVQVDGRRRSLLERFLYIILAGVLVSGCAGRSSPVRSHGRAGPLHIAATDGAAPATAARQVDRQTITLPAGSVLEIPGPGPSSTSNAPAEITYPPVRATLAGPADLVTERTRDELATATGHAPPSPATLARAWGIRLWIGLGASLVVLSLLLFARGHGKAGAIAFFGGPLVALLGHWVNSTAGIVAGAVLAAVALTLFAAWHMLRARGALASSA